MKNKFKMFILLIINGLLNFLFNTSANFLNIILVNLIIWLVLFVPYFIFIKKEKPISEYSFYYVINLFLLNILFLIFKVNFTIINILSLVIILIISLFKIKSNLIKYFNVKLTFLNVVFFFLLSSSMVPIGQGNSSIDYSVFRYVALLMREGKVLYRDVFDHKGPLLYFINYLGLMIDEKIGIWIIELLFLYVSILIIYKITKLFSSKLPVLSTLIVFSCLILTYNGSGNSVEQYGMFFILIAMYLFYRNLIRKKDVSLKDAFLIGGTFGAILMLRPNMIAVYICMAVYLIITYIKDKRINYLIKTISNFLGGTFIVMIPFLLYLIINDAFADFIYQYLVFNFGYTSSNVSFFNNITTIIFFLTNCKLTIWCTVVIVCFLIAKKGNKTLLLLSLSMIILTFIFVVMPNNNYNHYAIVLLPTFIYPVSIAINCLYDYFLQFFKNVNLAVILIVNIIILILGSDILFLIDIINTKLTAINKFEKVEEIIFKETYLDDNILVFGNKVNIYLKTGRFSKSKYPYQIPIIQMDSKLKEDFKRDISNNLPKLIIVYGNENMFFGTDEQLFMDCFGEIIGNYYFYYGDSEYKVYKLIKGN